MGRSTEYFDFFDAIKKAEADAEVLRVFRVYKKGAFNLVDPVEVL